MQQDNEVTILREIESELLSAEAYNNCCNFLIGKEDESRN